MDTTKKREGEKIITGKGSCCPFCSVRTAFENATKKASILGLTFHNLRRMFGTQLLERGVDIITIHKLSGHSGVSVTER
jgi:integrase